MMRQFLETINHYKLLTDKDRVLIAVSGGADSVCLLHLLLELAHKRQLHLEIAHLNHQLRGAESDRDADFVADLGQRLGIVTRIETVDVTMFAHNHKLSIEAAGRHCRYAFFQRIAAENSLSAIATAHTSDDQAETVLLNLLRGSGIEGMAGIPYRRQNIIRPMLDISKSQILAYLDKRNLSFCQDSSNESTSYTRNRIRHQLLPVLAQDYNPQIRSALQQTAYFMRLTSNFVASEVTKISTEWCRKTSNDKIILDLSTFFDYSELLQLELIRWCVRQFSNSLENWQMRHFTAIRQLANQQTGKTLHLPGRIVAKRTYNEIEFAVWKSDSRPFCYTWEIPGQLVIPENGLKLEAQTVAVDFSATKTANPIHFVLADSDMVSSPLTVRSWQRGDRIKLNRVGHRKVSDVFIDLKIPKEARSLIPLVYAGTELLWIVGYKRSAIAFITETTRKCLQISAKTAADC